MATATVTHSHPRICRLSDCLFLMNISQAVQQKYMPDGCAVIHVGSNKPSVKSWQRKQGKWCTKPTLIGDNMNTGHDCSDEGFLSKAKARCAAEGCPGIMCVKTPGSSSAFGSNSRRRSPLTNYQVGICAVIHTLHPAAFPLNLYAYRVTARKGTGNREIRSSRMRAIRTWLLIPPLSCLFKQHKSSSGLESARCTSLITTHPMYNT